MKHVLLPGLLLVVLLYGCGQPVCFMGMGDCSKMYDPNHQYINSAGLQINGPKSISMSQPRQNYQAQGGNGYYTYTVLAGAGGGVCGSFVNGSATNTTLPVTFQALISNTTCSIQATDSSTPPITGVLSVQITP